MWVFPAACTFEHMHVGKDPRHLVRARLQQIPVIQGPACWKHLHEELMHIGHLYVPQVKVLMLCTLTWLTSSWAYLHSASDVPQDYTGQREFKTTFSSKANNSCLRFW